ncbi:conjugative transposon protein TraM [Porphyromonas somerae]|uniref:conjugative transposon protein TraM n=1 Tax=Porphyromonas somerae TaxID=322095 RepID=UPI000382AB1F|nr:conjugative transposon protein TraM [Porphyromonas somerae]
MDLLKEKKNLIVLILLILMALGIVYVLVRPLFVSDGDRDPTSSSVVEDLPNAKTIDIMGKGIDNKIEPEKETTEEEEALSSVFESQRMETANNEIPERYDVSITDDATDNERMLRILELQERYQSNNDQFALEMVQQQAEEEKSALRQEVNTYKELYEQSVSDNNEMAQRVQAAERSTESSDGKQLLQVTAKRGEVVSLLGGDGITKSPFHGGSSKDKEEQGVLRNALKATVQQTITVKDGDILPIRLTEDAYAGNTVLRAGTIVNGIVQLSGNRLNVVVSNVEYKGRIMQVQLSVYDIDAQRGIYVPDGDIVQAASETASALGDGLLQASTSASQGFTMNSSAKDAAAGIVTRGVVAGVGSMLKGKQRVPTVTIRSGYKLFLMNDKNS